LALGGVSVQAILGPAFFALAFFLLVNLSAQAQTQAGGRHAYPPADPANPLKQLIPGEEFVPAELQAQQADDFDNPAYPFVEAGEKLWSATDGAAGKSCASCHGGGTLPNMIKGAASSYPKFSADARQVITLSTRINLCREKSLQAPAWGENSPEMISMITYLRYLSRGLPATVDVKGPAATTFERGSKIFQTKLGLLQLSCAQCHDERYGQKFGAEVLSQGHPLAYPAYEASQGRVITLHERFRMCNALVRAEPQPENAPDYVALELYLMWRSENLPITAPGVRQ
jgi:L-cysteine S-thiosulfotransferase